MFESLVEWKNGTVSTDIHLQAEISGSMPRVVLRESNKNKLITIFCKKSKIRVRIGPKYVKNISSRSLKNIKTETTLYVSFKN